MQITNITQRKLFFISIFFCRSQTYIKFNKNYLEIRKACWDKETKGTALFALFVRRCFFLFFNLFILLNFMFNGKAQIAALTEKHALHSAPYPLHALHSTFVVFVYAALHYPLLNVNQSSVALMLVSHVWDALVLFFHKWGLCC